MTEVTMPQLGETVTEGTINKWFKQVGDQVAVDEPLFEVSTDKVDSEVPSPASGYVLEIRVPEGATVEVGAVLAVLGASPPAAAGGDAIAAPGGASAQPGEQGAAGPAIEERTQPPPERHAVDLPGAAPAPPGEAGPEPSGGQPEPSGGQPEPSGGQPERDSPSRLLSPVVRRLIAEHGLDSALIRGTGTGGRITRNDVLAVADAQARAAPREASPAPATAASPLAGAAPSPVAPQPAARSGERDVPVAHTNIRRRTAEHMVRSKQTSAHVYTSIEVDYEAVEAVRRARKESWRAEEGFSLTYLPFVCRAALDAIREFPEINATFTDEALIVHRYVNLGIAVDLDHKGLIAPVVRDADTKRLRAIAREIRDLADRARAKQLGPDEVSGGTFTITNPGPAGTMLTLAIINQPQVAILSTDGVARRPVAIELPDGGEAIAIHSVGNLALTWDHRAFDGMYAAMFLAKVKELIETRDWAAELG